MWSSIRLFLASPGRLRLAAWLLWAISVPLVLVFVVGNTYGTDGVWVAVWSPLLVLVGWWLPRHRAVLLAVAAGLVAAWTSEVVYLWPLVSAYVLLSLIEDHRPVPVAAWIGGVVGSVLGMVLQAEPTVAPFFAVALGGVLGLLLRSRLEVLELVDQAQQLETQTVWLEQRTALARELHDVVGHHVTAMVVQAEAGLVGEPERALSAIGDLGRTALQELDALVVHLRDPDAPLAVSAPPRLSDVDELLAAPLRLQGVAVGVRIPDDLELDELMVLTVYRVVQEALTNVARHAQASAASVEVVRVGTHLRVRVSDDGVGVPAVPSRGAGLVGIEERVAARGGSVELVERLGGGTVVDVVLPLEQR